MKFIIVTFLLLGAFVTSGLTVIYLAPNYLYNQVVKKNYKSSWFALEYYSAGYLSPEVQKLQEPKILADDNLWKSFHISEHSIPLPVKNPSYFIVPKFKVNKMSKRAEIGLSFFNAKGEVLSELEILSKSSFPNFISSQKIFELPIVQEEITSRTQDQIWKDAFSMKLSSESASLKLMAYHLYLLEFRSKILKNSFKSFGVIENYNVAFIELENENKDYLSEIILTKRGNKIHSFKLLTRIDNKEANLIRYKMIREIDFFDSTPALVDIIFKEFKGLKYYDQISHTGMLYLLSAWSHDFSRKEVLEKMIFYLERGHNNQQQLKSLHEYYFERYNKIYSEKLREDLKLSDQLFLEYKIHFAHKEQEEAQRNPAAKEESPSRKLSIEEEFTQMIKKSKLKRNKTKKSLSID